MSHALRVRGLKPGRERSRPGAGKVARSTRAWIETADFARRSLERTVARSTRAWIETTTWLFFAVVTLVARSTRAWIETLFVLLLALFVSCRTLYACVD